VAVLVADAAGDDREVARLGPGELFGEIAAALPQPLCATVRATETCQVLRFDGPCLRKTLLAHPELRRLMVELGLARTERNLWELAP
jgi:CRP-like cAMP-binding protein